MYCWAGCVEYGTAYQWQLRLHQARVGRGIDDCFLMLTHPPVYTAGTRTRPEHLPSPETLRRYGARLYRSDRGGSITYHGPGQLVGYGIVDLTRIECDVHRYVRALEEAIIGALNFYGVTGKRHPQHTGVWIGQAKIASIGIKIARRVTMHGFALNVRNSLDPLRAISPCGITGGQMTSLATLRASVPPEEEIGARIVAHLARLLGYVDHRRCSAQAILQASSAAILTQ
ncbi:MAG: lipoyl(octanoyl) transferase LipB [Firmicutes bacterium]|nr:lipoyl(octanoyl) transferase LipB [Bacillota bacterium]